MKKHLSTWLIVIAGTLLSLWAILANGAWHLVKNLYGIETLESARDHPWALAIIASYVVLSVSTVAALMQYNDECKEES